jgi:hypothetical protein
MEHLFSPRTHRFLNILFYGGEYDFATANELNLDMSTLELFKMAFTYAEVYAMIEGGVTFAWLTPHTAVVREDGKRAHEWAQLKMSCHFRFSVDGKDIYAFARSLKHLLEIGDVLLRLEAASVAHSVLLRQKRLRDHALRDHATSLEYLMEQCQSPKLISLHHLEVNENQIRVLGTYSRPDLKIELWHCRITGAAAETLAEVLGRNQGPTKLVDCYIDNSVLVDGLRGNSRLKSLTLRASLRPLNRDAANQELLAISSALKENKGLVDIHLFDDFMKSDEAWGAICDSLKTHPTLKVLKFRHHLYANPSFVPSVIISRVHALVDMLIPTFIEAPLAPAVLKSRIQALVDMLKGNMLIHTIALNGHYREHELFRGSVIPLLKAIRLRPRLLAIQKRRPIMYRTKVLGRALLANRTDPNRIWMLLSGNPEVAFSSTTATIAVAADPQTPSTAAAAAAAAAAANVLRHFSGQMRNAHS